MSHFHHQPCSRRSAAGLLAICLFWSGAAFGAAPAEPAPASAAQTMTLDACLETAFRNNHQRPASQYAVAAAEAQHRQALSAYWPQISFSGVVQRDDQAPNFIFPASYMAIPSQTITTPASTAVVTVPAGVLGPTAVQLPVSVPSQTITTPTQVFPVPQQNVQLMDRDLGVASLDAKWLIYDGGMRRGLDRQAESGVAAMKQEARRTDLEIADSVRRYYYGAILARQLHQLGRDTLARMQAVADLTQTMYQGGGGKVTKSDYLDTKVMVESVRALVATLEQNEALSQAALANCLGLSWHDSIAPADTEIPFTPLAGSLDELVGSAYELNPDWQRLDAGLRAAEAAVDTARSGHYPKVGFTGRIRRYFNSYDAGLYTPTNKQSWTIGLGVELPLFDGFLTRARVAEMRAKLGRLQEQRILLKEGLGLQIKDVFLRLVAADKSYQATADAMQAAVENRDLTTRAYQNELVETDKVIRAQLMEALMTAQHLKTRYDHVALQCQLDLTVGREVYRQLTGAP